MASLDYTFVIPLSSWNIILNVLWGRVNPWVSWADTHWEYSSVIQHPRASIVLVQTLALELDRWSVVASASLFFCFFGFTDEAKKNYHLLVSTLAKILGYTALTEDVATSGPSVDMSLHFAPHTFATQQTESKSDSDSFSEKPSISTATNECELKLQPHYFMEQSASFISLSPHIDVVPRDPEPILELPLARRSVPDTTKAVHPNGALDQV